jgi:hypothetical protein
VSAVLDAALRYAAAGLHVFPCRPRAKEPATLRGFYSATTDPTTIRRWFGNGRDYNLAVRTGLTSGIWILDADNPAALAELEGKFGPLPTTRQSQSSRGPHFWWRATEALPSSASRIGPKIDAKAEGGYIMAPPSIHPGGLIYKWLNRAPIIPAPEWLVALARKPAPPPQPRCQYKYEGKSGNYGAAALAAECAILAGTAPGSRGSALNRVSFRLHQLVAGGEISESDVEREIYQAVTANGLLAFDGPTKVRRTFESGRRAGLQYPRGRR